MTKGSLFYWSMHARGWFLQLFTNQLLISARELLWLLCVFFYCSIRGRNHNHRRRRYQPLEVN